MKIKQKGILILIGILVILVFLIVKKENLKSIQGVVVKVDKYGLTVLRYEDEDNLSGIFFKEDVNTYDVNFGKKGDIGFKKGQEVLIHYTGDIGHIGETSPLKAIRNVKKIEIVKQISDIQIPDDVLRFYYNEEKKVQVNVVELNNSGITLNMRRSI